MDKKHNGAHNELMATCWLLQQGYEVFRNVSPHGAVDIVGMKDGQTTLFDVKKASLLANGEPLDLRLTAEQIAMGVKLLIVYGEKHDCRIIDNPKPPYGKKRSCLECGSEFVVRKYTQTMCSRDCRSKADARQLYISRHGAPKEQIMEGRQ